MLVFKVDGAHLIQECMNVVGGLVDCFYLYVCDYEKRESISCTVVLILWHNLESALALQYISEILCLPVNPKSKSKSNLEPSHYQDKKVMIKRIFTFEI